MSDEVPPSAETSPPEPSRPVWKNPFAIAFVLGIIILTVLPLMQRKFLKAPPPVKTIAPWSLKSLSGDVTGSQQLAGHVWMGSVVPNDCTGTCRENLEAFGRGVNHIDDLGEKIQMVTFVQPAAVESVRPLATSARWHFVSGTTEELAPVLSELRASWVLWGNTDAGSTDDEFARVPAIVVVDQNGAVRGFWQMDSAGRGNAINAVRLLAQYGPNP